MLSSLAHTQQLAANAVTEARAGLSSAAAASASLAAGAAAMLGRGLARAATRARTSAGGAAAPDPSPGLLLHPTALFTIREYGWAEVMTLLAQEADAGGMLEMEAHDLASGTAALYSRPTVGEPWTMVSRWREGMTARSIISCWGAISAAFSAGWWLVGKGPWGLKEVYLQLFLDEQVPRRSILGMVARF